MAAADGGATPLSWAEGARGNNPEEHPMSRRFDPSARWRGLAAAVLAWGLLASLGGCAPGGEGQGPGHRPQVLALTPDEELELGREAYRAILARADVLPPDHPAAERVRSVGDRIVAATRIRPLLREINLRE